MTRIIADACANHMGDRRIMEAMIKSASEVGVDFIKFQSFRADTLRKDWPDYSNAYSYYKVHELSRDDHIWLMDKCKHYRIGFITTVFDLKTVDMLKGIGVKNVKIASPDANNFELIDKCVDSFDSIIISTGMHTEAEIGLIIGRYYTQIESGKVSLLHCVSNYPTKPEDVRMRIAARLNGFSDHTVGTDAAKLAISMEVQYLERHFTLSRSLPTRDSVVSSTPEEFKEICEWRDKANIMMGYINKSLDKEELANREKYVGRWSYV